MQSASKSHCVFSHSGSSNATRGTFNPRHRPDQHRSHRIQESRRHGKGLLLSGPKAMLASLGEVVNKGEQKVRGVSGKCASS